ncbi:MAG: TetR/AcrR family transcriptional regulator, partial [Chloroflexota bacterium]
GVADGTIYNYFKNKDAILMGIIERLSEAEIRDMHVADAQQLSIEELITNFVPQRMKEADDAYPLFKAIFPEMLTNEALVRQIYDEVYMPVFPIMEHYFQMLIEQGAVPGPSEGDGKQTQMAPAVMVRMFASPLLGIFFLRLMGDEHISDNWDLYTKAIVEFLLSVYQGRVKSEE